jgi:hypothetical protein
VQLIGQASSASTVVVIHADRKAQRVLQRIAAAAVRGATVTTELSAALALRPVIAVVDATLGPELPARHPEIAWIAVQGDGGASLDSNRAATLLEAGWRHVITQPAPLLAEELYAVLACLSGAIAPTIAGLLLPGAAISRAELDDAADREAAVAALVKDTVAMGLSDRVASLASVIADELLSNAIFAAPVDGAGQHLHARDPRDRGRALLGRDRVELAWASDARYLAIAVTDQWGSIDLTALGPSLAAGVRGTVAEAGGGMGLSLVHACAQRLHVAVTPGASTCAIALIELRHRATELARTGSVHLHGGPR